MTNKEVVIELKSRVKPYIGIMSPSTFSTMCIRINVDLAKPKTIESFFSKFGYEGSYDNWELKKEESK